MLPRTPDGRQLELSELPIVRALQGEVVRDVDLLVRTAHGDVLMSTTANPVYDQRGASLGAVAVFADVTEQRAREASIQEELRALDLVHGAQEALAEGRLLIYAQPIIELASGETIPRSCSCVCGPPGRSDLGPAALLEPRSGMAPSPRSTNGYSSRRRG